MITAWNTLANPWDTEAIEPTQSEPNQEHPAQDPERTPKIGKIRAANEQNALNQLTGTSEKEDLEQVSKGTRTDSNACHVLTQRNIKHLYRRAFSELTLLDLLDSTIDPTPGTCYHILTGGDIDSLSFFKHMIRMQPLDYLLFSTWCMVADDIAVFKQHIDKGQLKRLDAYVGEIFPGSYPNTFKLLKQVIPPKFGRVCVFKNHSKIYAGIGPKFAFSIESSANINTNPRNENTVITIGKEPFIFYKEYFDSIKSFNREYDNWHPWNHNSAIEKVG